MRRKIDYQLLINILLIVFIGILMVYSASNVVASYKYDDKYYFLKRQLLFLFWGLLFMFFSTKVDIYKIRKYTTHYFLICLFLLVLVLIIGSARGGAKSWIGIGAFSIQPSEFMKIGVTLLLSKYLSNYYSDLKKFKYFMFILIIIILVFGLIMLQPDFGTGLVIVLSSVTMLFLAGAPLKYFLLLMTMGIMGIIGLIISAPYRLERILAFLNPWSDPLGSGFQGIQSILAVAPSGLFGLGYNKSIQKHFFLPEPQNDFIFSIICEELGLIGSLFLVFLYLFLFLRTLKIATKVEDKYLAFLALGIGVSIFIQASINICVVIGLLPITGITLPLVSYGGSSLMITLVSLGILLNISKYQEE